MTKAFVRWCILFVMAGARKPGKKASTAKAGGGFPAAFAALLKKKKITVPKGLLDAPPEAYASQDESLVEQLANLSAAQLKQFAEKVAGYAGRQQERARAEWERSPLVAELRRRKLKEPKPPSRPTGASVSLAKPLEKWSDKELLEAANRWSKLGEAGRS